VVPIKWHPVHPLREIKRAFVPSRAQMLSMTTNKADSTTFAFIMLLQI